MNKNYILLLCTLFSFSITTFSGNQEKEKSNSAKSLKLSYSESTEIPLTDDVRIYTINVFNTSDKTIDFILAVENINCLSEENNDKKLQFFELKSSTDFKENDFNAKKQINPKASATYIIKSVRPKGGKPNTWNCINITTKTPDGIELSDKLLIESYNPDTKDFR